MEILHVLVIDDSEDDAFFLIQELKKSNYEIAARRVETADAVRAALLEQSWDLVVADYMMPMLSAPLALSLVKERNVDVAFIVVSGIVGEDELVGMMRLGAHDYIKKGSLGRLLPAVEREIREARARESQRQAHNERLELERLREIERVKIHQAYKFASLGEMAGGIAHEVINPMTIILGKAEQALQLLETPQFDRQQVRGMIDAIIETSKRVVKVVHGLKTISRPSQRDPFTPTKVATLVEGTLAICVPRFKFVSVRLTVKGIPAELELTCRPSEISQVLLNLLNNAYDAVAEVSDKWVELEVQARDEDILFRVSDSGPGVPAPLQETIFEQFFTTKGVEKGTGLGLSISRDLIRGHGGSIWVDAESSVTSFMVSLPSRGAVG